MELRDQAAPAVAIIAVIVRNILIGEIVKQAKVESHPDALVKFFKAFGLP
jgi:hypothetical protein